MSARDDYTPADLLSGSASLYEALWTELDALRAAERRVPYVLYRWDESADENRGGRSECGVYRTQVAAQAEADRCNEPLMARINADAWTKYEQQMAKWKSFQRDTMPVEPVPITDFLAYARRHHNNAPKWADSPCRAYPWHDHYYVEPLEFEG